MSSDAWSLNPVREKQGTRFLVALLCAVSFMALIAYAHKAAEDRSAFVRWRYQVIQLMENGRNIYDREMYPNPPVMPITLYPLMMLPPLLGAVAFFVIKVGLAILSATMIARMARERNWPISKWCYFAVAIMSLRPILSDLQHGNINILILFMVVLAVDAWTRGRDWLGGFEKLQDPPRGTLTSEPFRLDKPWASFLIGGGPNPETRVELVDNGTGSVLARVSGMEEENLRRVVLDLARHQGKVVRVRGLLETQFGPQIELADPEAIEIVTEAR